MIKELMCAPQLLITWCHLPKWMPLIACIELLSTACSCCQLDSTGCLVVTSETELSDQLDALLV